MFNVETTEEFDAWLVPPRRAQPGPDRRTSSQTCARAVGWRNPVGEDVTELREHFGPGFRVYVTQLGATLVVVLGGGDTSTQRADIRRAVDMARRAKE